MKAVLQKKFEVPVLVGLAVGGLLVLSETLPKASTETPIPDEETEQESTSRLRYDPKTGEYTCDAVDTVETGNLRIEVHLDIALEDGTNVPDCFELGHTGFIVYRGETKLIEFDAEEAYIKERLEEGDDYCLYFSCEFFSKFSLKFPRHPEKFPVVIDDNGYFEWKVEDWYDTPIPPEYDVTGDGSPNLVVKHWSGGVHCCFSYYVFDVGDTPRLIDVLDSGHADLPRFYKFNDTPGLTLSTADWTYAYWNTSFAGSPRPQIYLSFDPEQNRFVMNTKLMKLPIPEQDKLDEWVARIKTDWATHPETFWWYMLELIYKGNLAAAKELMEAVWPPDTEMHPPNSGDNQTYSKDEFWNALIEKIGESQFAEEIFAMNAQHICSLPSPFYHPDLEQRLCRVTEQ